MATLKQRIHRKNSSGGYDLIHLETEASLVYMASGMTVEDAVNGKADTNHTHSGYAASSHTHAASNITSGTLASSAIYAVSSTDYTTARIRNISASTTDLTASSSALSNGNIYLVYT